MVFEIHPFKHGGHNICLISAKEEAFDVLDEEAC